MNTQEIEKSELKETLENLKELILHNDDYNTFDHVIDCLIATCNHEPAQAEQCAYIVHYNGKCSIKRGSKEKLELMFEVLKNKNLTVEIK